MILTALAPIATIEADLGPVGWVALGATAIGAGIYALVQGIKGLGSISNYAKNQESVNRLNQGIKDVLATESELDKALANTTTSTNENIAKALEASNKAMQQLKSDFQKIRQLQDSNGNVFRLTSNNVPDIVFTKDFNLYDIEEDITPAQNAWTIELNLLKSLGILSNNVSLTKYSAGPAPNIRYDFLRLDGIESIDWNGTKNVIAGTGTVIVDGKTIPISVAGIGVAVGTPTLPVSSPDDYNNTILASSAVIGLSGTGVVTRPYDDPQPITIPRNNDYISQSVYAILSMSIWWNKTREKIGTKIRVGVQTRTKTKTKDKEKKKPKKKKNGSNNQNNKPLPETIREIEINVHDVSAWINRLTFRFPTQQPIDSDEAGTLTFHLRKGGQIRFVRVKRGTFSVIADYYGTGYRLWSQFWKHKIVNKWRLSWAIKRITKNDRVIGIDTELYKRNCKYK